MLLDHWGTPVRDTLRSPEVSMNVKYHPKLNGFLQAQGINANDYNSLRKILSNIGDSPNLSDQRLRTWRKLFQYAGLLYTDSNGNLATTDLGRYESDLLRSLRREWVAKVVHVLKKFQLKNPTTATDYPDDCDVFPYWCIWKAMCELDGKLHHEELNRVLLKVMRMSDLDAAIDRIRTARSRSDYDPNNEPLTQELFGDRVQEDQPSSRMDPWFSLAGHGGLLINTKSDSDGYKCLNEEYIDFIQEAVATPPQFRSFNDTQEWFMYYGSLEDMGSYLPPTRASAYLLRPGGDAETVLEMLSTGQLHLTRPAENQMETGDELFIVCDSQEGPVYIGSCYINSIESTSSALSLSISSWTPHEPPIPLGTLASIDNISEPVKNQILTLLEDNTNEHSAG